MTWDIQLVIVKSLVRYRYIGYTSAGSLHTGKEINRMHDMKTAYPHGDLHLLVLDIRQKNPIFLTSTDNFNDYHCREVLMLTHFNSLKENRATILNKITLRDGIIIENDTMAGMLRGPGGKHWIVRRL